MRTFRWTVPEPRPESEQGMGRGERVYWQRVRARGPEWYTATKGLLFLVAYPVMAWTCFGTPIDARTAAEGWLAGMIAGTLVWMRRESRYRRGLEEDGLPLD